MPICSLEWERKAQSGIWSPAYSLPPAFSLWQSVFSENSHGKVFPDTWSLHQGVEPTPTPLYLHGLCGGLREQSTEK